ncbi:MAG: DUF362 domain-containing protein [candidate division Zixibacteria bacterium]|nr:DUF362 domain-containing protein [candidate division Zixibacteria bacterium]
MSGHTNRREFIKTTGLLTAGTMLGISGSLWAEIPGNELPSIVVVKNGSPAENTRKAVALLGGMGRFVKKGDTVVVKPNIGWDRKPEQAANTTPEVVSETIKLCFESGADKVLVFDNTCNNPKRCYANSGIAEAAEDAGAIVSYMADAGYKEYDMPEATHLKKWAFYSLAMEADCIINVPIAKHHGIAELTLGMKNLMGVMGGMRGRIHWKIHQYLPEIAAFVKPELTIIDATRILKANGPQGGNLDDVERLDTIIASPHIGTADAYATDLFGKKPTDIGYIINGPEYGLGEIDIEKMNLRIETI